MNTEKYMPTLNYSDRHEVLFFKDFYSKISGKILDIGCGTGNAADFYADYTGITLNPDEITTGTQRGRRVLNMNAEALTFIDGLFDGFIMWDSLEHFISPYIALNEARRVLKNGGKGLIFMPGQNWVNCHEHLHVMTVPQMLQIFRRTFFKTVNVWELKYPDDPNRYCEGMAVYLIEKDNEYVPEFMV